MPAGRNRAEPGNFDNAVFIFLRELVLPLKKRRMQPAGGRSGGDMLCDLSAF
jgi:hypothetical protein